MIPDWLTNCVYVSQLLPKRHPGVWEGLKAALTAKAIPVRQLRRTKDLWIRDFAPIQVAVNHFVKFRYEPDYLKGHETLITDASVFQSMRHLRAFNNSPINLDGGNVVASENTVILTEKVLKENREIPRAELRKKLQELFQGANYIFVPKEPFDPIGHSDGLVRFIDNDTVLVNDYSRIDKEYGRRLRAALRKHRLNIEEIPYFIEGETEEGIQSAVGCYANYLRTEKVIVMPIFGVKHDDAAVRRMDKLFPGTTIVPLRCEDLARKGGVLNCCTWSFRTK